MVLPLNLRFNLNDFMRYGGIYNFLNGLSDYEKMKVAGGTSKN